VASFIGSPAMNFIPCRLVQEESHYHIDTGDYRITLPDFLSSKVSAGQGDEFIFGIRPEHFLNKLVGNGQTDDLPVIKATINVIETLGKETFLDLNTGAHSLTALLDADIEAKTHQDIELVPNMDKIHLFNSKSGVAIF
jgi:multiple sugar transport system ATP-binding protein